MIKRLYRMANTYILDPQNMLINWSDFKKGRLILFFGILSQLEVARWLIVAFYTPEKAQWLNPDYFELRVTQLLVTSVIYLVLFWSCFKFQHIAKFQTFIAYFAPSFFGMTMIYSGYSIGIYSPATMQGSLVLYWSGWYFIAVKLFMGLQFQLRYTRY